MTRSSKANVKRDPDAKNKGVKKEGEDVNGIEPTKLERSSLGQNQARRHVFFLKRNHETFLNLPPKCNLCIKHSVS